LKVKGLIARNSSTSLVRYVALAGLLLAGSLGAYAQGAGYDVFQTGSGASVDLSSVNLGVVPLQGVAIQSSTGNADTIMYRPQAVPTGGGTIPVNLYALFMKSTSPVTLNGQSADVYVTVNNSSGAISQSVLPQPDALSASTGTMTVTPDSTGAGGTFDSSITINADIIFVPAGTSVTNPANYLGHQPAPPVTLSQTGATWSTSAPSGYPLQNSVSTQSGLSPAAAAVVGIGSGGGGGGSPAPSPSPSPAPAPAAQQLTSGGFFVKVIQHKGPHPVAPAQTVPVNGGRCPVPISPAPAPSTAGASGASPMLATTPCP
jgi:hypothetical protein